MIILLKCKKKRLRTHFSSFVHVSLLWWISVSQSFIFSLMLIYLRHRSVTPSCSFIKKCIWRGSMIETANTIYLYHGFVLKAFEELHTRIAILLWLWPEIHFFNKEIFLVPHCLDSNTRNDVIWLSTQICWVKAIKYPPWEVDMRFIK